MQNLEELYLEFPHNCFDHSKFLKELPNLPKLRKLNIKSSIEGKDITFSIYENERKTLK